MVRQVTTRYGELRGTAGNDARITVYKGVPFAKPPVRDLRWKAPEPCEPWDGVRTAHEFGPISMQDVPGIGDNLYNREWHVDPDIAMSEDCLYLNIWTPAKTAFEKLPVIVFYYGGAFQWGYTAEMEFNGERLARQGVIVVTVGYRLGAFGFLAHPELSKEDPKHPSNFGLLDQQAGLEWVYDNITIFGGDPRKITIGGQSAGGGSVLNLLTNPVNKRYVKGAAIFSGIIDNPFVEDTIIRPTPIETVEKNGEEFLSFLGVSTIEEARKLDAEFIRDSYATFAENHPRFVPCIDKRSIPDYPLLMLNTGKCIDVPIIAGFTGNEFFAPLPEGEKSRSRLHPSTLVQKMEDGKLYFNVVEDSVKTAYSVRLALIREGAVKSPMYIYKFNPPIPGDDNPGAFHSCDLWFFFGTLYLCHRDYGAEHYELSKRMVKYFTDFIKTGMPEEVLDDKRDADGDVAMFI